MNEYNPLEILSDKKVLCVEDEEIILNNIVESLELFFGKVVGVKDGLEALDEALGNIYDVLMLDISIPHIDGLEVVKKIRQVNKKIPIIILSAHTEQEYLWRAVELKITRYLTKPTTKTVLSKHWKKWPWSSWIIVRVFKSARNTRMIIAVKLYPVATRRSTFPKVKAACSNTF